MLTNAFKHMIIAVFPRLHTILCHYDNWVSLCWAKGMPLFKLLFK